MSVLTSKQVRKFSHYHLLESSIVVLEMLSGLTGHTHVAQQNVASTTGNQFEKLA